MRSPRGSTGAGAAAPPIAAKGSIEPTAGCVDMPPMRSASGSTDPPAAADEGVASYPAIRSPSKSTAEFPVDGAPGAGSSIPMRSPRRSPAPPPPAAAGAVPVWTPRPATPCSASFDFITNGGRRSSNGAASAGPASNILQNSDARCCNSTFALVPALSIAPRTALVCVLNRHPSLANAVIAVCFTALGAWISPKMDSSSFTTSSSETTVLTSF